MRLSPQLPLGPKLERAYTSRMSLTKTRDFGIALFASAAALGLLSSGTTAHAQYGQQPPPPGYGQPPPPGYGQPPPPGYGQPPPPGYGQPPPPATTTLAAASASSACDDGEFEMPGFAVRVDPLNWLIGGRLGFELEVQLWEFITFETIPMFVTESEPVAFNLGVAKTRFRNIPRVWERLPVLRWASVSGSKESRSRATCCAQSSRTTHSRTAPGRRRRIRQRSTTWSATSWAGSAPTTAGVCSPWAASSAWASSSTRKAVARRGFCPEDCDGGRAADPYRSPRRHCGSERSASPGAAHLQPLPRLHHRLSAQRRCGIGAGRVVSTKSPAYFCHAHAAIPPISVAPSTISAISLNK